MDPDRDLQFGLNGAIGIKLPIGLSLMLFVEGRIDHIFAAEAVPNQDDLQIIPVTFGIIFQAVSGL